MSDARGPVIRRRAVRAISTLALVVLAIVALLIAVVVTAANTRWGREQVRTRVVALLDEQLAGRFSIGRLEGNLLTGVRLVDVSITDTTGRAFLQADTVATGFRLLALVRQRIQLHDVRLVRPVILLDQSPADNTWNWERIFLGDSTARDTAGTGPGWGDWISLERLELVDGRVMVRMAWEPDSALQGAARDSAIAAALSDSSRALVESVPEGFQTVYDFQALSAILPELRVADPAFEFQQYELERLATTAFPFRPPPVRIENFAGTLYVSGDSLWFNDAAIRLPGSEAIASLRVGLGETTDVALAMRSGRLSTGDIRFLYPPLVEDGEAALRLGLTMSGDTMRVVASDLMATIEDSRIAGTLGVMMLNDTLTFMNTDLTTDNLAIELVERLVPGSELPIDGTVTGSARFNGPLRALHIDADLELNEPGSGISRAVATGEVGMVEGGMRMNGLQVEARPLQVALARQFMPDLAVRGQLSGTATADGRTNGTITSIFNFRHSAPEGTSRFVGRASVRMQPEVVLDVDADVAPLNVATLGSFAPDAGLHGMLSGPVKLRGPLSNVAVDARLTVNEGGSVAVLGSANLAEPGQSYAFNLETRAFNVAALTTSAPSTSLTLHGRVAGAGMNPETLTASVQLTADSSGVARFGADSLQLRATATGGLVTLDTLRLWAPGAALSAGGTFGIAEGRAGRLAFRATVDSLHHFASYLPPDSTSSTTRPAAYRRMRAAAVADSLQRAQSQAVQEVALGRRMAEAESAEDTPVEIPRDSLSGSLYAAGVLEGGIGSAQVSGRAGLLDLVAMGSTAREARVEYRWLAGLTDSSRIQASASVDELLAFGFALDSVSTDFEYGTSEGSIAARVWQDAQRDYVAAAEFELAEGVRTIRIQEMALRFDSTTWQGVREAAIRIDSTGLGVDSLELRDGHTGRIFANGLYPRSGAGELNVSIRELPVGQILALVQEDAGADGLLSVDARLSGDAADPEIVGAAGIVDGAWREVPLPTVRSTFSYSSRSLRAELEALGHYATPAAGRRVLYATAQLPVDLALSNEEGRDRLPDEQIVADITADSLPFGLVAAVLPEIFERAAGSATGQFTVRGTTRSPELAGGIELRDGVVHIIPLGVTVAGIAGSMRLDGDTVIVDSLAGYSRGRILVRGGIGLDSISAPSFDLYLVAEDAHLLDNDIGDVYVDAGIAMRGPYDGVYVSGAARIREGVFYIPEADTRNVIAADDPALFAVADRELLQEQVLEEGNPLLENLSADVRLLVDRGTWVRSREANVEIFTPEESGPLEVSLDQSEGAILLEGVVSTERGTYEFLGRRFELRQGSVVFVGTPTINPTLQLRGENVVNVPAREALTIRILIGGTMSEPVISLESDAQPPLSQSDLISYLALGQSSSTLLQQQGSSVTGGGSQGLVGTASEVVTQRLPAFAMNVLFNELLLNQFESSAGRRLGADVFNITPADVPIEAAASDTRQLNNFLVGTEVELGRYFNQQTFVSVNLRPSFLLQTEGVPATQPGLRVQFRPRSYLRFEGTFEPRFLLREPTLETRDVRSFESAGVLGFFITREWRW